MSEMSFRKNSACVALLVTFVILTQGVVSDAANIRWECDFEPLRPNLPGNTCGFTKANTGLLDFDVRTRVPPDADQVPRRDNETGGYFLFEELRNILPLSRQCYTLSPLIEVQPSTPSRSCLRFWLHMKTAKQHELTVVTVDAADTEVERDKFVGGVAPTWKRISVDYRGSAKVGFKLFILAGSFFSSSPKDDNVAIDDVVVEEGLCAGEVALGPQVTCDFQSSDCNYTVTGDGDSPLWYSTNYNAEQANRSVQVPLEDSTYHTANGRYMLWFHDKAVKPMTAKAVLQSPEQSINGSQCLTFQYQTVKHSTGYPVKLEVTAGLLAPVNKSLNIYSTTVSHGYKWTTVKRNISVSYVGETTLVVNFTASAMRTSYGMMAVDDIHLSPGLCSASGDCNFDNPKTLYCDWQSISGEEAPMLWTNGIPADGPIALSPYIYFRVGRGSGNYIGMTALLLSDELSLLDAKCLTFNYFMNTTGVADIRIYMQQSANRTAERNLLWRHDGRAGLDANGTSNVNVWRAAKVPLTDLEDHEDFAIALEGRIIREISSQYMVAVDDIVFQSGPCDLVPDSAEPVNLPKEQQDFSRKVCTFDDDGTDDYCGFTNDETAKLQWVLRSADEGIPTGAPPVFDKLRPAFDHTTLEEYGRYLYFETKSGSMNGDYARQVSAVHKFDSSKLCLRFWYQFTSTPVDGGALDVYLEASGKTKLMFSTDNLNVTDQRLQWTLATVSASEPSDFQLIFEGWVLKNYAVVMAAVDDIMISEGDCDILDCDFEEGLCGWHNQLEGNKGSAADLMWEYQHLPQMQTSVMQVPIRASTPLSQKALLEYAGEMPATQAVCLTFDFLISKQYAGSLALYMVQPGPVDTWVPLWKASGNTNYGSWMQGQIAVNPTTAWTLVFEAEAKIAGRPLGNTTMYTIALDNIAHTLRQSSSSGDKCETLPVSAQVTTVKPTQPSPTAAGGKATQQPEPSRDSVIFDCSFDDNMCEFTQKSTNYLQWRRGNAEESNEISFYTPVPERPTTPKSNRFLIMELLHERRTTVTGEVISATVTAKTSPNGSYCLKFWQFLEAYYDGSLTVVLYGSGTSVELRVIDLDTSSWELESIDFEYNNAFQIGLVATVVGDTYGGVLAIDDLVLRQGKCSADSEIFHNTSTAICDFEESDCGFKSSGQSDKFAWEITTQQMISALDTDRIELAPSQDSTYHTAAGHYAFAYMGPNMTSLTGTKTATLTSTVMDMRGEHCISFFYRNHRLSNSAAATLSFSLAREGTSTRVWSSQTGHGKKWIAVKRAITQNNFFSLVFEVSATSKTRAGVAVDDVALTEGACTHPGDCTFNDNLCSWQQTPGGSMRWVRQAIPGLSGTDGRPYLYFKGGRSSGNLLNARALLYSPDLTVMGNDTSTTIQCMTFSYFMNATGNAVVRIHQVATVEEEGPVWENYGRAEDVSAGAIGNNAWRTAKVPLQTDEAEYLITIEGVIVRETDAQYIMAIDDVQFLAQPCVLDPPDSQPIVRVKPPLGSGEDLCTFDDDVVGKPLCGWDVSNSVWQALTGRNQTTDANLPYSDHSTQEKDGVFLYFNSTANPTPGTSAWVISTMYTREREGDPRCLRFWYFFAGSNMGRLEVSLTNAEGIALQLWSKEGTNATKYWTLMTIPIPPKIMSFQLVFAGQTVVASPNGGIAIDDVSVAPFACRQIDCDFEHGMCNWENNYEASDGIFAYEDLEWQLATSELLPALNSIPDHGYFVYVPIRASTPSRHSAVMESKMAITGGQLYCVSFDFAMTRKNLGLLAIFSVAVDASGSWSREEQVWSITTQLESTSWQSGQILINRMEDWTILFQYFNNPDNVSMAALRDTVQAVAVDNIQHRVVQRASDCNTIPFGSDFELNCDFNNNWCGFTLEGPKEWRRASKDKPVGTGAVNVPIRDPNEQDDSFLVMDMYNALIVPTYGEAVSPIVYALASPSGKYCLKFWMYMNTKDFSKLRVILRKLPGGQQVPLDEFIGVADQNWTFAYIDFATDQDFEIRLYAKIDSRALSRSVLAVDNLILEKGGCSEDAEVVESLGAGLCDFEEDDCSLVNSGDDDFVIWKRTSGESVQGNDLEMVEYTPNQDSTHHTIEGHYALALFGKVMDNATSVKSASYKSEMMNMTVPLCLSFYYRNHQMKNKPAVTLSVSAFGDNKNEALFTSSVDHGKRWMAVKRPITRNGSFALNFKASGPAKARGGIAIDDLKLANSTCDHPGDCKFNKNDKMCSWQHLETGLKMRWLNKIATGGPLSESYYMYFEGGRATGNLVGSQAIIYSDDLSEAFSDEAAEPQCMTFAYFFNASGAAVVRVHQVTTPEDDNPIWEHYGRDDGVTVGEGGNPWRLAKVPLTHPGMNTSDYLITFEGTIVRETDTRYIMAIDDVQFLSHPCSQEPADSVPRATVSPPTDADETVCSFDDEENEFIQPMCGWNISDNRGGRWELLTAQDLSATGVENELRFDHTTLEDFGKFLYFTASAGAGSAATAVSQTFTRDKPSDPRCLRFWYYFEGRDMGHLIVSTEPAVNNTADPVIWYRKGTPTTNWALGMVSVPEGIMSFNLLFTGQTEVALPNGSIAIDDISMSPYECRPIDCDFEHGMCNYENFYDSSGQDDLDWEFATAETLSVLSNNTDHGYFLYVPIGNSTPAQHTGYLRHYGNIAGGSLYCLQFDYALTAKNVGWLTVFRYYTNATNGQYEYHQVWNSQRNQDFGSWQSGQVLIDRAEPWTVMFEVTSHPFGINVPSHARSSNGIALDNIKHTIVTSREQCQVIPANAAPPTVAPPVTPKATTRTSPRPPTTTVAPVPGFNCNFNGNGNGSGTFCGWTQRPVDKYKWLLGQKGTTGQVAGPVSGDYSPNRDGSFAYIDAPAGTQNDRARLFSPFVRRTRRYCLRFFFNANGLGAGDINLYYVNKGQTLGTYAPPFTAAGRNFGDQWIGASYQVDNFATEKQFVLEAVRGSSPTSFLAIDEVTLADGTCEPKGGCDFDNGWCLYNPFVVLGDAWQLGSDGVNGDVYAVAKGNTSTAAIQVLHSEAIPVKGKACLRFQYRLNKSDSLSSLNIYIIQYPVSGSAAPNRTLAWTVMTPSVPLTEMQPARMPVSTTRAFQISIEAVFKVGGEVRTEEFAIDELDLTTTDLCSHLPLQANPNYVAGATTVRPTTSNIVIETIAPTPEPTEFSPLTNYSCNFDDMTLCGWTNNGSLKWNVSSTTVHPLSGPDRDVSGRGYFAYLDVKGALLSTRGRLESPSLVYPATAGEKPTYYVLSFWYMMHGSGIDQLNVRIRNESGSFDTLGAQLWVAKGDHGKKWKRQHLVLSVGSQPIRVAFDGYRAFFSTNGFIALDEVTFEVGKIPDQFDDHICDFDTPNFCGYSQSASGRAETTTSWTWKNGLTSVEMNDTGPTFDKSQNSQGGYYMAFDGKNKTTKTWAYLDSTVQSPASESCVKFYYYRRRSDDLETILSVSVLRGNTESLELWSDWLTVSGDFWEPVFISVRSPTEPWRVRFAAQDLIADQPIIAIDHVVITNGTCQPNLLYCDFNEDTCEWSDDLKSDHVDWVLSSGASEITGTGPSADADDEEEGGYLLFEAAGSDVTDVARLISPPIDDEACLKFWYHMYGDDVGELTIFQRDLTTQLDVAIWQLSGNQFNQWHQARTPLTEPSRFSPYQVIIEAKRLEMTGIRGNIAIDNIEEDFSAASCSVLPAGAVYVPTIPPTEQSTLPSTVDPTGALNLTCYFESGGPCAWTIIKRNDTAYSWKHVRAGTAALTTGGPSYDHTRKDITGHYLLATSSASSFNQSARLESPFINDSLSRCLTFFYHAYGPGVGSLRVLSNSRSFPGGTVSPDQVLWFRHSPDEGRVWQIGQVDLKASTAIDVIIFEAVGGAGSGDIALDDISAAPGLCHPNNNFCDFESSRCNFKDVVVPNMEILAWHLVSPADEKRLNAPQADVSLGTSSGHYLTARLEATSSGTKAITSTPEYDAVNMDQCFQFYYNVQGQRGSSDTFSVTMIPKSGQAVSVLNFSMGTTTSSWHVFNFQVGAGTAFSVEFEADLTNINSSASIDNVLVRAGTCRHELDCQFDTDSSCLWTSEVDLPDTQITWSVESPALLTKPGPTAEHTTGSERGWIALVNNFGFMRNQKARLLSPELPPKHYICVSFWYFFSNMSKQIQSTPNTLTAFAVDPSLLTRPAVLWQLDQRTAPGTGQWLSGQYQRNSPWGERMGFEAELHDDDRSFIALDDIKVNGELCEVAPEQAKPGYEPTTPAPTPSPAPEDFEFNCNFDDGTTCVFQNLTEASSSACRWINKKGPSSSLSTGPPSDHTLQNRDGGYLYFEAQKCIAAPIPSVGLTTINPLSNFRESAQCLQFWYHMFGSPNLLTVSANFTDGVVRTEFARQNNQGDKWLLADVTIDNPGNVTYKLVFEVRPGGSRLGDIALDDISLTDGDCPSTKGLCDFENQDFCKFELVVASTTSSYRWKSAKVATLRESGIFPDGIDHTFLSSEGHVAYVSGVGARQNERTYMRSQPYTPARVSSDVCVTFWYQVPVFPGGGKLRVHILHGHSSGQDFSSPVWSVSDGYQGAWEYGTASVSAWQNFRYAFEAWNEVNSLFVIDDIRVIEDKCPRYLSCDFEDGMCGWTQGARDDFSWVLHEGRMVSGETPGPTVDHTSNSVEGHYVYIGNSLFNVAGDDTAYLTSQRVPYSQNGVSDWCFSFWYHMHMDSGANDATLEVLMLQSGSTETSLLVIDTLQRNMWMKRSVSISNVDSDFRISFKGTMKGGNSNNAIALDDLHGENMACPKDVRPKYACPGENKLIDLTQVCDQVKDCSNNADEANCGACSFDSPSTMCGYDVFTNDEFTWAPATAVVPGSTDSLNRGAGAQSSAAYLYADFAMGAIRSSTYLDSPLLHETSAECKITFWYHMASDSTSDPGALIVSLLMADTETILAIIDRNFLAPSAPWQWQQFFADVGRRSGEFRFIFRARKGSTNNGYIAVDEIKMNSCQFTPKTDGACPDDEWKCPQTEVCIYEDQRCDFTDDCGKGEDEEGCDVSHPLGCNFDTDLCSWSHSTGNDFNWAQIKGQTTTAYSGPLRDHTTGLKNGGYAYLKSSTNPAHVGKKGRLVSPVLASHTAQDDCRLRFYFHMYGSTMGELRTGAVVGSNPALTTVFDEITGGDHGDTWQRKSIPLVSDVPFRVAFEGMIGGKSSDIAIDDVSFSENCRLEGQVTKKPVPTVATSATTTEPTTFTTATSTLQTSSVPQSTAPTTQSTSTSTTTMSTQPTVSTGSSTIRSTTATSIVPSTVPSNPSTNERTIEVLESTTPAGKGSGLGGGGITGIVIGVLAVAGIIGGMLFVAVRRKRAAGDGQAGAGWLTYGYKNFSALDGVTSDETDDSTGNNQVFTDIYSDNDL